MTEREKMIQGLAYDPQDSELVSLRRRARMLCRQLEAIPSPDQERRQAFLQGLFGSVGKNAYVESGFQCDYGVNIHVGDNFYANFQCVFLDVAEIVIGHNCLIAPQVGLYTATHALDPEERKSGLEYAKPIVIGDDCWIGGGAKILPGVTLGRGTIVAAGAVVTKSFGDYVVVGGCPAQIIKSVPQKQAR